MRYLLSRPLVLAALLALQSGCYDVYQPAMSPRIEIRGDGMALKNGKKVESLAEAVRGNPAAEVEVQRSHRASETGTLVFVSGLGGTLGAALPAFVLGAAEKDPPPGALALLSVAGAVYFATAIIGMGYWHKAAVHERNAINLYNDGLAPSSSSSSTPAVIPPAPCCAPHAAAAPAAAFK
jgi:hypothetical protein